MSEVSEHDHPVFARFWKRAAPTAVANEDRVALLAALSGTVVEVGAGTGVNFAFYPATVTRVIAVEPEPHLRAEALVSAGTAPVPVDVVEGTAEALPVGDGECDGAVTSLVLCSVSDQAVALSELARVVRPGGELRFYEHVVAHKSAPASFQRWLDRSGIWPHMAAGCHVARDTLAAIEASSFAVTEHRRFMSGIGPFALPHIAGSATRS
ncbi:MAG: class I SAM-dependent methyltransferase [Solirubrobacteraceae bacterium]|nr:class I SAM-dependent methyltransferase [Solirubrobacteraceae bacterium]